MLNSGGFGGAAGGFPAPGIPGANTTSPSTNTNFPAAPFNMFAPPAAGVSPGAGVGSAANPFGMDPAAMQQLFGMMGGGAQMPAPAPADTRPPEERFQVQLQVSFLYLQFFFCLLRVGSIMPPLLYLVFRHSLFVVCLLLVLY